MLKKFSGNLLYILITLLVLTLYLDHHDSLAKYEVKIQDLMLKFRGKSDPGKDVVVVAVDDQAINQIGHWPWPKATMARFLDALSAQKPKVIAGNFPLPFTAPDTGAVTDSLADVIKRAKNVILPVSFTLAETGVNTITTPAYITSSAYLIYGEEFDLQDNPPRLAREIVYPEAPLDSAAFGLGHTAFAPDPDGMLRWAPLIVKYEGFYYPSLAVQAARAYYGLVRQQVKIETGKKIWLDNLSIPIDDHGQMLIAFRGPANTFPSVSAADVLSGRVDPSALRDKVAVVGMTATGLTQQYKTAIARGIPRVEVTATVIENIIHRRFYSSLSLSTLLDVGILILIGVFSALILPKVALLYRAVILAVFAFAILNFNFILFASFNLMPKVFYPMMEVFFFLAASFTIKPKKEGAQAEVETGEEEGYAPRQYQRFARQEEAEPPRPERARVEYGPASLELAEMHATQHMVSSDLATVELEMKTPEQMAAEETQMLVEAKAEAKKQAEAGQLGKLGRYQVLQVLGKGAMGTVYKGLDPALDRLVALKTIRMDFASSPDEVTELRERLLREAKAAGKLSHPNIVTVYDVGQDGDIQYIAMEYLQGYTLEEVIKKKVELNFRIVASIITQICNALEYAHDQGIVHRDIKPANIMVLNGFNIKVMDFGIARIATSNMTQSGVALGTPNYISPEQLTGQEIDRRADIFALGVVMYEFLTRKKPFTGESLSALIYNIINLTPPPPSQINDKVPELFDRIILRALEKSVLYRYQRAGEIAEDLKTYLASFRSRPVRTY